MASSAYLLLPSVRVPATSDPKALMASTNQVLLSLNTQLQQISSAFTLTKPTITADSSTGGITVGNITMGSRNYIRGGAVGYNSGVGFWLGYDTGAPAGYKFFVGSSVGNKMTWDGSTLAITGSITATTGTIGGWTIGSNYIQDTAGVVGLSSAVTAGDDVRFWAGSTTKATAPFRVTEAGLLTATAGTIGGWALTSTQILGSSLTLNSAGAIYAGQTGYNTGTGFWLGLDSSTPKFSIGNASTNYFKWDGTNVLVQGGASPNYVIINTTGFSVGVTSGLRVALGTYSGNAASLNFYGSASPSVSRLGIYLNGGTAPAIDLAYPSGASLSLSANSADFAFSGSAPFNGSFYFNSSFGTPIFSITGPAGTLSTGPYISITNSTNSKSSSMAGDGFRATDGSSAVPAYSFTSDTDTGWKWAGSGDMRAVCNAAEVFVIRSAAVVCLQPLKLNNNYVAGAPAATGYVTLQDGAGNTYKVLVGT